MDLSFSIDFPVVGGFTEATCTFSTTNAGQTVESVTWTHNNSNVQTGGGRVTITTDDLDRGLSQGESRLEISRVDFSDAGDYACTVQFSGSRIVSDFELLKVASKSNSLALDRFRKLIGYNFGSQERYTAGWVRVENVIP